MPPLLDLEDVARFTNRNRLGPVTDCRKKSCAKKLPADMKELPSFPLLIRDDRQFSPHTVITCFAWSTPKRFASKAGAWLEPANVPAQRKGCLVPG